MALVAIVIDGGLFGRARKSSTNLLRDEVPNSWVALGRGVEQINGVAVEVSTAVAVPRDATGAFTFGYHLRDRRRIRRHFG